MIKMTYDNNLQRGDIVRSGGNLEEDDDLTTAVLISLFTERRAAPGDDPATGRKLDKGGWWADSLSGDPLGSRLWLLRRAKATQKSLGEAKIYCDEALAWLIEDKVAKTVEVTTIRGQGGVTYLGIMIDITKPDGTTWAQTWEVPFNEL